MDEFFRLIRAALFLVASGFCGSAGAQDDAAADRPDFSGLWILDSSLDPVRFPDRPGPNGLPRGWMVMGGWKNNEPPPLSEEGLKLVRSRQQLELSGTVIESRTLNCQPSNFFDMMTMTAPLNIMQREDKLLMLSERELALPRHIYIDGKYDAPTPHEPEETINGYSVAHWEGDSLVVKTTELSPETWLFMIDFIPHQGAVVNETLHLEEDGQVLSVTWEIHDEKIFSRPWTINLKYQRMPDDAEVMESVCDIRHRAEEFGG